MKAPTATVTTFPADNDLLMPNDKILGTLSYTPTTPLEKKSKYSIYVSNIILTDISATPHTTAPTGAGGAIWFEGDTLTGTYMILNGPNGSISEGTLTFDITVKKDGQEIADSKKSITYNIDADPSPASIAKLCPTFIGSDAAFDNNPVAVGTVPPDNQPGVIIKLQVTNPSVTAGLLQLTFRNNQSVRVFSYDITAKKINTELSSSGTGTYSDMVSVYSVPMTNGIGYVKVIMCNQDNISQWEVSTSYTNLGKIPNASRLILFKDLNMAATLDAPKIEELEGYQITYNPLEQGINVEVSVDKGMEANSIIPHFTVNDGSNTSHLFIDTFKISEPIGSTVQRLIPYDTFTDKLYYTFDFFATDGSNIRKSKPVSFLFLGKGMEYDPPQKTRLAPAPGLTWKSSDSSQELDLINSTINESLLTGTFTLTASINIPALSNVSTASTINLVGGIKAWTDEGDSNDKYIAQTIPLTDDMINKKLITYTIPADTFRGFDSDSLGDPGSVWLSIEYKSEGVYSKLSRCKIDTVAPGE